MTFEENIGVIVLAGGGSKRLGQPKQLVQYRGNTLLQNTINATKNFGFRSKKLILGARAKHILEQTNPKGFEVIINESWKEGIASSIRLGVHSTQKVSAITEILILLTDQPYSNTEIIKELIANHHSSQITACSYKNTLGVPAIFTHRFFPELLQLEGDQGAKKIILEHSQLVHAVPFPLGSIDIDNPEDLHELIESESRKDK